MKLILGIVITFGNKADLEDIKIDSAKKNIEFSQNLLKTEKCCGEFWKNAMLFWPKRNFS